MKFVIVVERGLRRVEVIGPFEHEEDASRYAHAKHGREITIWRVAEMLPPSNDEKA